MRQLFKVIKIKKIAFLILISFIVILNANAAIKDSLIATVGNKPITKSDIINEIKILLILSNESYSDDKREKLYRLAMKSAIRRNVKLNEIEKNPSLEYSREDFQKQMERIASNINLDVETLKNVCASNNLDFSLIEEQVITELLWNSLIFKVYKNRLSINLDEIEEKLKSVKNINEIQEFLISEIVINKVKNEELESHINNLKKKIEIEGFENVAMDISISESASKGGDLGWLKENIISEKFISAIISTPIGKISKPIMLSDGIVIFKIRDKRRIKIEKEIEKIKSELVHDEKTKILNMFSLSHYDSLRRSLSIIVFNE